MARQKGRPLPRGDPSLPLSACRSARYAMGVPFTLTVGLNNAPVKLST